MSVFTGAVHEAETGAVKGCYSFFRLMLLSCSMVCFSLSNPYIAAKQTKKPRAIAPTTMYQVTGTPAIWHIAKKTSSVTAMVTKNARTLMGILPQVGSFTTSTMMFVMKPPLGLF